MILDSDNYKSIAREALHGHWFKAVITGLLAVWLGAFATSFGSLVEYTAVTAGAIYLFEGIPGYLTGFLFCIICIALFYFFIGGVIRLGFIDFNLAMLDRREAKCRLLFAHFDMLWKMILTRIAHFCILSLTSLLLIVPGIMSYYSYSMVPYILEEKPLFSVSDAFRASRKIMQGHKWQLFLLRLSFIGWNILGILTLGIGFLFIIPYRHAAEAVFYNEISGRADVFYGRRRNQKEEETSEPEEEDEEES